MEENNYRGTCLSWVVEPQKKEEEEVIFQQVPVFI
jgi:hypothetical protein